MILTFFQKSLLSLIIDSWNHSTMEVLSKFLWSRVPQWHTLGYIMLKFFLHALMLAVFHEDSWVICLEIRKFCFIVKLWIKLTEKVFKDDQLMTKSLLDQILGVECPKPNLEFMKLLLVVKILLCYDMIQEIIVCLLLLPLISCFFLLLRLQLFLIFFQNFLINLLDINRQIWKILHFGLHHLLQFKIAFLNHFKTSSHTLHHFLVLSHLVPLWLKVYHVHNLFNTLFDCLVLVLIAES